MTPKPKPMPPIEHRFKKGISGNPGGRSKMTQEQIQAKKHLMQLTIDSYREVLNAVLSGNLRALKGIAEHPDTPAFKVCLATSVMRAIKEGDYGIVEKMAERIIGKIPEVINVNSSTNLTAQIAVLDRDMLKKVLLELESSI